MEFFLGSLFMLITLFGFSFLFKKQPTSKKFQIINNQTRVYEMTKNFNINKQTEKINQSSKHKKTNKMVRILTINNVAYWIEKGNLYQADMVNKNILEETKKRVDTHSMDRVELDKIIFIVDKLTEGNDDSSNTGH